MIRTLRPADPLYASQWHFAQIGRLGAGSANTLGIERVWADHTGAGVKVGVWDDGVQAEPSPAATSEGRVWSLPATLGLVTVVLQTGLESSVAIWA